MARLFIQSLLFFTITSLTACSSVPTVNLTKDNFNKIDTIKVEARANDDSRIQIIKPEIVSTGFQTVATTTNNLPLKKKFVDFMKNNDIVINEIVKNQFIKKLKSQHIPISFDEQSQNKLIIGINIAVIGKIHGFSDKYNVNLRVQAQLFDKNKKLIWSYNPYVHLLPYGHFMTLNEIFSSKEAMVEFFAASANDNTAKLAEHFSENLH